jgi:hypothetical protein
MSNAEKDMEELLTQRGAIGAALVDYNSGMTLMTTGSGMIDLDLAAAGNAEVVRCELKIMDTLRLKAKLEDVLITLTDQYHLIRLVSHQPGVFIYYVLRREDSSLALARRKLAEIADDIIL